MNRWIVVAACLGRFAALHGLHGQARYFPPNTLSSFEMTWYGKQLDAMHEVSIDRSPAEMYRFLWLRTWHEPVAVRVGELADSGYAVLTVLTGQGGYDPGVIARRDSIALGKAVWEEVRRALDRLPFWSMRERDRPEDLGMDGAEWILEGHRSNRYRLVQRWSPSARGGGAKFRAVCLQMLAVAGYRVDASTVY